MADPYRMNPNALTPHDLALILSKGSANRWRVTEDEVRADIEAGAPTNPDGTIHLMTYCAWLIRERGRGR
ncbi:MAG: hypothetical protein KF777_24650 [Planctomycetaceae bacterium]|nr:hypothetical protein [Planctomycetaceae bacterium]